jgi:DNA-binding NarL/FixJ family response regulator
MTTIFVADDHPVISKGLKTLLEVEHEFRVVGSTTDGLETAQLVEHHQPDVLILDLMMPGLNGLEVIRRVKHLSPNTHVLVYSMHNDPAYVHQAMENGASGYLTKDANMVELVKAVRKVASGEEYLQSSISSDLNEYSKKERGTRLKPDGGSLTQESGAVA